MELLAISTAAWLYLPSLFSPEFFPRVSICTADGSSYPSLNSRANPFSSGEKFLSSGLCPLAGLLWFRSQAAPSGYFCSSGTFPSLWCLPWSLIAWVEPRPPFHLFLLSLLRFWSFPLVSSVFHSFPIFWSPCGFSRGRRCALWIVAWRKLVLQFLWNRPRVWLFLRRWSS